MNTEHGQSPRTGSPLLLMLSFAAVYLIWGSTYLAIRVAVEDLPPFSMAAVRFLTAGGLLYAWARFRGAPRPTLRHWRTAAIVGGLLLLGGNGGVVWAEQRLASGPAALLVAVEPLWIALLVAVWPGGERPRPLALVGIAAGFAGVALLTFSGGGEGAAPEAALHLPSALAVIFAAFTWALGSVYAARTKEMPDGFMMAAAQQMLAGGTLLAVTGLGAGEISRFDPQGVGAPSLLALGYMVVFGSLVGFLAYGYLLRSAPSAVVSTYAYVNPIVAVFLGWLFLDEPVSERTIGAAALILAAVAMVTFASRPRRRRKLMRELEASRPDKEAQVELVPAALPALSRSHLPPLGRPASARPGTLGLSNEPRIAACSATSLGEHR